MARSQQRHGLSTVSARFSAVYREALSNRINDLPLDGFSTVLKP
jgi:hypothetical protein